MACPLVLVERVRLALRPDERFGRWFPDPEMGLGGELTDLGF